MVKSKTIEQNDVKFTYTYSDEGKFIARDGIYYFEAIDPIGSERDYTEVDTFTSEETTYEQQMELFKEILSLGIYQRYAESDKDGYDLLETVVGETVVKSEYIKQASPLGSIDNPIEWQPDQVLVPNAYYNYNNTVWLYLGGIKAAGDSWDGIDFTEA